MHFWRPQVTSLLFVIVIIFTIMQMKDGFDDDTVN